MPATPAVTIGASPRGPTPSACASAGPVKAIACVSKPSKVVTRKHNSTTRT